MGDKKNTAPEVEAQKQQIKIACPVCGSFSNVKRKCPNCNCLYTEDNNYCTICGAKLENL